MSRCRRVVDPKEAEAARRDATMTQMLDRHLRMLTRRNRDLGMSPSLYREVAKELLSGRSRTILDLPTRDDARFVAQNLQRYIDSRDHRAVPKQPFFVSDEGEVLWWSFVAADFVDRDAPDGDLVVATCSWACPHGDRCTLPRGHEGGHNHRGCDCNEPDQPPCDQCGERKPAEPHVHATAGRRP